jgi:hypothetical protein
MKQIIIIGLILILTVPVWAQQTDNNAIAPEKTQQGLHREVLSAQNPAPQQDVLSSEKQEQGNVLDYNKSQQSPQKIHGKIVKNTASDDKKVREKSGSASSSGEKQVLEKKNVKSDNTTSDLEKALKTVKKVDRKKNSDPE